MSHCVLKEHQVECGVDLVVAVQSLQQGFIEAAPGFDRHILGLPGPAGKVAVQVHLSGPLQSLLCVLRECVGGKAEVKIRRPTVVGIKPKQCREGHR